MYLMPYVVVVRLLRAMERKEVTPIFSSLQKLPVPPQTDGVVGSLNCGAFSLYLSTMVSLLDLKYVILILQDHLFMCTFPILQDCYVFIVIYGFFCCQIVSMPFNLMLVLPHIHKSQESWMSISPVRHGHRVILDLVIARIVTFRFSDSTFLEPAPFEVKVLRAIECAIDCAIELYRT